jgi:hypothetical protein
MSQDDILAELEAEVQQAKTKAGEESEESLEIELEPEAKEPVEEPEQKADPEEYSKKVQNRIKKLVEQRRKAELQTAEQQEEVAQLKSRLARLEQGSSQRAENDFNTRYQQTKAALAKSVEEGDTNAQLEFTEQIADMRAAMRIAELQKMQRQQETVSPTVGRAQQQVQTPAPQRAMDWWEKNRWFKASGYERETELARSIDAQLDLEGYDKDSAEYYEILNNRLQKIFPELKSGSEEPKSPREKSRAPVAPTAGGSGVYKGNRVKMSQDQLRMARELGIQDEKSLKLYAEEVRRQNRS